MNKEQFITFINGLKQAMPKLVNPNYDENDPTKPSYIKNRPFFRKGGKVEKRLDKAFLPEEYADLEIIDLMQYFGDESLGIGYAYPVNKAIRNKLKQAIGSKKPILFKVRLNESTVLFTLSNTIKHQEKYYLQGAGYLLFIYSHSENSVGAMLYRITSDSVPDSDTMMVCETASKIPRWTRISDIHNLAQFKVTTINPNAWITPQGYERPTFLVQGIAKASNKKNGNLCATFLKEFVCNYKEPPTAEQLEALEKADLHLRIVHENNYSWGLYVDVYGEKPEIDITIGVLYQLHMDI